MPSSLSYLQCYINITSSVLHTYLLTRQPVDPSTKNYANGAHRHIYPLANKIAMKTFQYKLGEQTITIRLDEKQGTIADFLVDGYHTKPTEAEMPAYAAAISLALIEHEVEIVHDDEPGIITVKNHRTNWNNPAELMTQI